MMVLFETPAGFVLFKVVDKVEPLLQPKTCQRSNRFCKNIGFGFKARREAVQEQYILVCLLYVTMTNVQLLATLYLHNNQPYACCVQHFQGRKLPESRYLFAISCFQMNLLREAEKTIRQWTKERDFCLQLDPDMKSIPSQIL